MRDRSYQNLDNLKMSHTENKLI